MSRSSDAEAAQLLAQAAKARMMAPELHRWRQVVDPIKLDLCGCYASAKAATIVALAAIVIGLRLMHFGVRFLVMVLATTLAAAMLGKILGQRTAAKQRSRFHGILARRVQELEAAQLPAAVKPVDPANPENSQAGGQIFTFDIRATACPN